MSTAFAASTAQNPAMQQMIQQFMSGGQQVIKPTPSVVQSAGKKEGQAWTPKNIAKNTLDMHTLPFRSMGHLGDSDWLKKDMKRSFGLDIAKRYMSPEEYTKVDTNGIQNNAPQLDWTALMANT